MTSAKYKWLRSAPHGDPINWTSNAFIRLELEVVTGRYSDFDPASYKSGLYRRERNNPENTGHQNFFQPHNHKKPQPFPVGVFV